MILDLVLSQIELLIADNYDLVQAFLNGSLNF